MKTELVDGVECVRADDVVTRMVVIRLAKDLGEFTRPNPSCSLCPLGPINGPRCRQYVCGFGVFVDPKYVPLMIMRGAKFDDSNNG